MAEKLIQTCITLNYKSESNEFDIIQQINSRQAALDIKLHFAGPLKNEPNIYKALSVYFSKHNTCVLCSQSLYLLIWKRCKNLFYVYDPNGRTKNCTRDLENGKSASVFIHYVEHLIHFIVNISRANLNDEFKLYEIFLTSYGKISNSLPAKPFPKVRHKKWAVVNQSFAVIPGCNNGIFQPSMPNVDNPSMLISVMAILYAHIECGSAWRPDQVDELVRLGTAYYKSLRRMLKLKETEHVTIIDLPDKYVLGTFKASIKRVPFMYTGTVTDLCKKYTDSLLICGMQELFDSNGEAALLQVDNCVLGVWRDSNFYYVYDPFRRGKAGQVLDPEDYRTQGAAILQIHANSDSLLKNLYESSVKIRRGAKFFIHAINVGCIKPIMDGKPRKLRYPKLKLIPETYEQSTDRGQEGDIAENLVDQPKESKEKKSKKSNSLKEKLNKVCSIETLGENDRIVVIRSVEIVEPLVEDVVCEIVDKFPDTVVSRPKLYESARRVLLRSDKDHLEYLKYMLQHDEDFDNIGMTTRTEEDEKTPIISVEEELQVQSNFKPLPDGTWIIFGSQAKYIENETQFMLTGLLSSIVTAALTTKYNVSTWTSQLVDYAWKSVDQFGDSFSTYRYALGALLHNKIPKIQLGDKIYQINVKQAIESGSQKPLRELLIETLVNFSRLLVICQRFCCLIVKRFNFLYMFCGFPVNGVGYRKFSTGPGCIMRFLELDSLIRRIDFGCNPYGCDTINYVAVPLKVWDITLEPNGRYRSWPKNIEEQIYNEVLDANAKAADSKKSKINFLNKELAKEKLRVNNFETACLTSASTTTHGPSSTGTTKDQIETENEEEDFSPAEESFSEECTVEMKHYFASDADTIVGEPILKPHPPVYGYRLREKDLLYKIQGSLALDGRTNCVDGNIKPCLVASALAILYAVLKPIDEWTSYRIDQIIEATLLLSEKIENMSNMPERILKNVSVDDYSFKILLKDFNLLGLNGKSFEKQLEHIFTQKRYLLLQTANCSYAIIKQECYNLFDPYPSMALMQDPDESANKENDAETLKRQRKYFKSEKLFGERNTASWILFHDTKTMIEYLNQRSCTKNWNENQEYKFLVLEIMSFKKAPRSSFILQMLTDMQSCNIADEHKSIIYARNETIAWLDHHLPIWSRLNRKNAVGRYRDMTVTKLNMYHIEIEESLWSLWGNLHPQAPVFDISTRGKQYLACCVICLCAASIYRLVDWSPNFLDVIIISGDNYFKQSLQTIKCQDHQVSLEDLDTTCELGEMKFQVHFEMAAYGKLYSHPNYNRMNLAEALMYFFKSFQFGILQCYKKCLAIGFIPGNEGGYFMFDCQSRDKPLFSNGQGSAYILRTRFLQILLYCIVVTLNIPYYNIHFTLHKVIPQATNLNRSQREQNSEKLSEQSSQKSSSPP